jgi:hypothetical protein
MCDKPVSTTNLKSNDDLTCFECNESIMENEGDENFNAKRVKEKQDKDDEAEWRAIPQQGCEREEKNDEEE